MQLISLTLKNIRSYKEAKIEFPTGTVILSGDIGAGKSTILLAIEFALFGVLRGELSGNALLRNGNNEGSTELMFKLNDVVYVIKRALKRTKKSVEQDAGYLLVNGVKKEATPTELKSHILDLLGYPPEMLTKGKNLVYRYTVYTPQEEMKKILLEEKEQRVAILRKVFGIDKYERITQNAGTYAKTLREKQRACDAALTDYEEKKKQLEETKKEQQETKQQVKTLEPKLNTTRKTLLETKKQLETIEKQKQQAELLTRELHTAKSMLLTKKEQHKQTQTELQIAMQQLQEAQKEIPRKTEITKKEDYTQLLLEKEQHNKKAVMKITELNTLRKQAAETSNKISILSECPTCLQQVTQDHKHKILTTEKQKITEIEQELIKHDTTAKQTEQEIQQIKQEIEKARQQEKEQAIAQMKILRAEELARRKTTLEQQNNVLMKEAETITTKIGQLEQELKPHQELNTTYEQTRKQAEQIMSQERQLSIEHSALLQKEQNHAKTTEMLEKEIERKQKIKQQLEKTQKQHQWLTDYFVPLMDVMEKHVMTKIHHEFDALFQQWFSMLIEDVMTARLDETFTPIIQQNGYDTEVENLSGGERTACALAYRLALNKTINSLISNIKTKDLLILDEPTDGFSTEQLDKMRDVLEQLHLNQIIIVSHEQKIESFADNIIRIQKEEHASRIT